MPREIHSSGLTRSSVPVVNSRSLSGTKAHRVGSGGGVEVTASSSFPIDTKSNTTSREKSVQLDNAELTNDVMREVVKIEVVLIVSKRI